MPAKAGIQNYLKILDYRLRGNDVKRCFKAFYETIKIKIINLLRYPRLVLLNFASQPYFWSSHSPAKAEIQKVNIMDKQFFVYILASKRNGTLYTGITSDLVKRVWQHKNNSVEGFTKKYNVKILVYYEIYNDAESAITREKRIKKWRRAWKLRLIEEKNPHWKDLYDEII